MSRCHQSKELYSKPRICIGSNKELLMKKGVTSWNLDSYLTTIA